MTEVAVRPRPLRATGARPTRREDTAGGRRSAPLPEAAVVGATVVLAALLRLPNLARAVLGRRGHQRRDRVAPPEPDPWAAAPRRLAPAVLRAAAFLDPGLRGCPGRRPTCCRCSSRSRTSGRVVVREAAVRSADRPLGRTPRGDEPVPQLVLDRDAHVPAGRRPGHGRGDVLRHGPAAPPPP